MSNKFVDKKSGVQAEVDDNGYLHFRNLPLLRSGIVQQKIQNIGSDFPALTNQERAQGWAFVYRDPKHLFSSKTLESWVGVPLMMGGASKGYSSATVRSVCWGEDSEPCHNRPLGTVIEVSRGKGRKSDMLFGHVVIWNVHEFARQVVSNHSCSIAPCVYITNKKCNKGNVRIQQVKIKPNAVFLANGDAYGFDVLRPDSDLRKWFQKNVVDVILPSPSHYLPGYKACSKEDLVSLIQKKGLGASAMGWYPSLKAVHEDMFLFLRAHIGDHVWVTKPGRDNKYYFNGKDFVSAEKLGLVNDVKDAAFQPVASRQRED